MSKKTLSLDLRERVAAAVSGGMSRRQAAERFGVSAASAIGWRQRQKETGSPASYKRGGDRWSARTRALILSLVEETCDITLKELSPQLAERGAASASAPYGSSPATTSPGKKDRPCERAGPPGHPEASGAWFDGQLDLDAEKLVFIDETWRAQRRRFVEQDRQLARTVQAEGMRELLQSGRL